jgi:hypothetical protein
MPFSRTPLLPPFLSYTFSCRRHCWILRFHEDLAFRALARCHAIFIFSRRAFT